MPEPEPVPVAAYERRAQLRRERTRLVGELHRRDGTGHREINAWLNRASGIARVEEATIKQLEHSVGALARELARGKRATAWAR